MSHPASGICFYCSNRINPDERHVWAQVCHYYQNSATRESDRDLHSACFEKFESGGRPCRLGTADGVLDVARVSVKM